jgi:predicted site-specific integrase-resolvase
MTENNYLTQTQLAERGQVTESTLERWLCEGIGPIYMKMMDRVRYRLSDITDFEEDYLRGSTSERASARNDRR